MDKASNHRAVVYAIALGFSLLLCSPALRSATLFPKFGFSVPSDADAAKFGSAAASCGLKDSVVFLPPVTVSLGVADNRTSSFQKQEGAIGSMPEGSHVFVRLEVEFGTFTQTGKELENTITRRIAEVFKLLPLENPSIEGLLVEVRGPLSSGEIVQFALSDIVVKGKARKSNLQTVFSFQPDFVENHGDILKRMANYYDALGTAYAPGWHDTLDWIREQALNKPVYLKLEHEAAVRASSSYVEAALATAGSSVDVLWVEQPDLDSLNGLCSTTAFLSRLVANDFAIVASTSSPFTVTAEGSRQIESRVFLNAQSQDIGFMVKLEPTAKPESILLHGPSGGQFETKWYDALANVQLKPGETKTEESGTIQACVPGSAYTFIQIRNLAASGTRLHSAVEVVARADLTVEEVIARWQQYRELQRQRLEDYIADCFMNMHFEPTGMGGSGFDVSMQLKQFWNREGLVEWLQSEFYVNGVKFGKGKEFPLPQLEPEKVVSQPLELKLDEKYTYKLHGIAQVDGVMCYVVGVEPKEESETLYSGRIWIDGIQFRHVKMELRQRGAKGNVISNIETQNFALVSDGKGNDFNLIKSIYAQQTLNAAGRTFILQKTYTFSNHSINPVGFESSLAGARLSDSPMYRDTDTGLQILRKEGNGRVLVETGKRVRSVIGGILYEGSFDYPVPLAGVSLVDFDYRKTGAQLSVFFAGPVLAANLSKQWKSRYRVGLDLALSALPENNRLYSGSTELSNERLYVFEETTGFRTSWQATTNLSLTGAVYVSYNFFRTTSDTAKGFVLPRNGFTVTPNFEFKYARTGYVLTAGGSSSSRLGWKDFGMTAGEPEQTSNRFDRYFADFSKSFYYGKFTKTGFDLGYYSGDKLDRFSRYRTSFLGQPRIKGIPSGTDSFDTVGIASVNHGINLFEFIKFEGSYNHAWARNKAESRHFRGYDGLEFDFGTAGPWSTYLQGTVTYALTGNLDRYNSRWGFYFLVFKPLR